MKRVLHILEIVFYIVFAAVFIGLLFYFLGVQPMRGEANQINVWICICFVCGGMLTMAVYNLSLRFFTSREKAALYFAVFCLGQTFRFFFMPDSIGWQLFPELPELFVILGLRQIPYSISLAGLILFVYEIFGEGRSVKIKHALIAVTVFVSFSITAFGFDHTIWRTVLGLPLVAVYAATCISVIVRSPEFRKNRLSALYLLGFILYVLSGFFASTAINSAPYVAAAFNFVFAVIHSILLSYRFAKAERNAEDARLKERELAIEKIALERVSHLRTELMRTVSHEMRTPLAVMMGFAELTAEEVRKKDMSGETASNLDTIAAEARRMTIMLEELSAPLFVKEFSKDMREISAEAVIRQIAGLYEKILERKNVRLILNLPERLSTIYANEHELTQVMFNLLRNADKYTESGWIAVNAEESGDKITCSVIDTGAGIDPELLPCVFERGISGEKSGMGFGLSICRDIITAHSGRIWLESEPGKGTAAFFTLPVHAGG